MIVTSWLKYSSFNFSIVVRNWIYSSYSFEADGTVAGLGAKRDSITSRLMRSEVYWVSELSAAKESGLPAYKMNG